MVKKDKEEIQVEEIIEEVKEEPVVLPKEMPAKGKYLMNLLQGGK